MSDLIAAERIKLLSLRSSYLFLAGSMLIAVVAAWLLGAHLNIRPEYRASYPSLNDAFNADTGSLLMTLAGCFGAVTMTGEYSSGLIRTTCVAVPARGRMVLAKAAALAAVTAVTGLVATAAVLLVALAVLSPGHYLAPLNQPGGPRVAVAFTLLMPLGAITGVALGSLLRRPVTAVLAVVAVLALLPGVAGPAGPAGPAARHLTMYGAWSVLANQPDPGAATSIAMAWLVFCGWPVIAFTLAVLVARRRDIQ